MKKDLNQSKDSRKFSQKVGDKIEKAGTKLKDMGAEKLGQSVYNLGNKIEHSKDIKNR